MLAVKEHFRPEFLNRLDDILLFNILSPEAVHEIVKIQVDQVVERLAQKKSRSILQKKRWRFLQRRI